MNLPCESLPDSLTAPADADLVFEIHFTCPPVKERAPLDAQLRLLILDPKSHVLLWAVNEHMQWAVLQSSLDRNFDSMVSRIVGDLKSVSSGQVP